MAQITGVAVGTVKSRASRGRVELKDKLSFYAKQMGLIEGEQLEDMMQTPPDGNDVQAKSDKNYDVHRNIMKWR